MGDVVILLNPAFEASRHYNLNELAVSISQYPEAQRHRLHHGAQHFQPNHPEARGSQPAEAARVHPLLPAQADAVNPGAPVSGWVLYFAF